MKSISRRIIGHTASGKPVPHARASVYTERHRVAKWNDEPNLLNTGVPASIVRRQFPGWTAADHMDAARLHAIESDRLRNLWGRALRNAEKRYGMPPVHISAGVSEIFPASVNDRIREYARGTGAEQSVSYVHYRATGKRSYSHEALARR